MVTIGVVEALRRYPVKSMLGEGLSECEVGERGVAGDRVLALLDRETGQVASAKNPRWWRELLGFRAAGAEAGAWITCPDGKPLWSGDADIDEAVSGRLGRRVSLIDTPPAGATLRRSVPEEVLSSGVEADVRYTESEFGRAAPAGTFFDFAPLHLLATTTLAGIARLGGPGEGEAERYRPNLVIRTEEGGPFAENAWVGRELLVGADLRLRIVVPTPRCVVPTLAHGELPGNTEALRVPARYNRVEPLPGLGLLPCVGAYAQVLRPGRVRRSDPVSLV
ncbi:MOSC domain-containing protein [Saccharothrix sp. ST-888]|uniref:MOSC domain-containing protein n=1 Tax=Saccharothrix sp. ST-888 TaxID=1427391 RepID=UPI0005ED056F|nr:MOSC N-terminal beta barrel domain-containing protein [Saccharothrix sp. ST-888]KJK58669.1 hypothetical protein UK12_08830 [Saccharothrix sp. ST-888]